ncbi:43382_t:CDS:1, partial [Gigaspora margarita]
MLFSVTPHAAGCKRIWSTLGWYYGKCRTRLSLNKIENMQKLSAFYLANLKNELPYFFSNVENLYEALSNINFYDNNDYDKEPNEEGLANEEKPANEERSANEERLANEERPRNKERPANEEYTNKETKDTFVPLEEKILKIEE